MVMDTKIKAQIKKMFKKYPTLSTKLYVYKITCSIKLLNLCSKHTYAKIHHTFKMPIVRDGTIITQCHWFTLLQ